ncbi:hypothetical protein EX895_003098 [Sporisorium graminicola]|uniref:Molybdopterin synthase sulfur carrier subunit n=1 Tax=Sporisorium graminicola TaxID=280036 RepID=A0A4U7KYQ1_9BASI|nr:hypothetical protein EX895_003098 [Sporisorium graminicola]TKY88002.1 hypothetical protein EX895_003098 [Sporisorium graminicola]
MSSGSSSIRVLYFAAARTTIGHSSETLTLPSTPFPLASLVSLIAHKYSDQGAEAVLRTCRWSVDNTLIEIDEVHEWTLHGGEEVAAIPPVSGGHHYSASPNGVDSNLLILLHGLGDSDAGFFGLGKNLQKTLPQTAVLTLQAPHKVPFLDGPHWMWYPSFDQFGELLSKPNPTQTVTDLIAVLDHLLQCGWSDKSIHLFGFGQGGTVALETLVRWSSSAKDPLGSVVSVSGELISHPTQNPASTPVLHIYRSPHNNDADSNSTRWASHRKATSALQLHRLTLGAGGAEEAMLRGPEWDAVMQFWAKFWRSRSTWEIEGEAVPVPVGGLG